MNETIQSVHFQTLCTLATGDQSTLQYPLPDFIFGFHAQQTCEKFFKALITAQDRPYPFTHSLKMLVEHLAECQEVLPDLPYDILQLEPFAVEYHYGKTDELGPEERTTIRAALDVLSEHILKRIHAAEAEFPPQPMT